MLGCRLIDLDEPTHHDQIKKLIVYIEADEVYYKEARDVTWPDMNLVPEENLTQSRKDAKDLTVDC